MRISSPLPARKARLEIIPLIDIMFFLLASFMLVSLSMTRQRTIDVNLPAATTHTSNLKPDNVSIALTASGTIYLDRDAVTLDTLEALLRKRLESDPALPVFISGDAATPHGAMVALLDHVRRCGVYRVAFRVRPRDSQP